MTTAWLVLAAAGVILGGIHLFLFWWERGPAKRPEYARAAEEGSVIPGEEMWPHAFGIVYASPLPIFIVVKLWFGLSVEKTAFWTLAAFIGGQLLLLVVIVLLWALSRRRRVQSET